MYTTVIQHFSTLQCDHSTSSSNRLSPCRLTYVVSLTVCPFTFSPPHPPSLATIPLVSVSMNLFFFCSFVFPVSITWLSKKPGQLSRRICYPLNLVASSWYCSARSSTSCFPYRTKLYLNYWVCIRVKYIWLGHVIGYTVYTILGHKRTHNTWVTLSQTKIDPRTWDIAALPLESYLGRSALALSSISSPTPTHQTAFKPTEAPHLEKYFPSLPNDCFPCYIILFCLYLLAFFWQRSSSSTRAICCPSNTVPTKKGA